MKNLLVILLCLQMIGFAQNPNYSEDIAPIIYGKCLQCHYSGGVAPFSLESYTDAATNAGLIQHVVSTGEMPPWPPDTSYQRFSYENILSLDEISKITDWITIGAPIGDTNLLPQIPTFPTTSSLGNADLEIQIPTYSSTATSNTDDYVCFSIPTGLTQNREIRAIEVIPGNLQTVHHAIVSLDAFPNSSVITTPNCMGPQGGTIYTWAPGSVPLTYPVSQTHTFGVNLPANSSLSISMHYPEGSFGQLDSTKVKIYFHPVNTVIREIYSDYLINEGLLGQPFILPPNQITQITGIFGPTTQDYSFMSVFPHMHLLGKSIEMFAVSPLSDTINLIKINNWDFEWQGAYLFKKFLKIPTGSMIYASGFYDNTQSVSNPNPVTVQSGLNTQDEMFVGIFQFLDYEIGDENIILENTNIVTSNSSILPFNLNGKFLKVVDILGRETIESKNIPLFYLYDDGRVEKRIILNK